MTEFELMAENGGVAQLKCPICETLFIAVAHSLIYRKIKKTVLVFITCPDCGYEDFNELED